MTKIVYSKTRCDGDLYFECKGHSGYKNPDTGNNDVCVMVSALCSMLVRYIDSKGYEPKICEDGHIKIEIEHSDMYINEVFDAAMLEFASVAEQYPEHLKVY